MVISYALFFALGLLPSFAWLIFFLKEDIHPEPKKMVLKVFISGFLITFVVIAVQFLFQDIFNFYKIADSNPFSLFAFALIEEILKFAAVYFVVIKSRFFDEPIDAMIYMIVAALGFAMLENLAIMFSIKEISEALGVITVRFVGATLLHALTAAIIGYWWAKGLTAVKICPAPESSQSICDYPENVDTSKVWTRIAIGIAIATVLHTFFNYLIMSFEDAMIYPVILLIIVAMFIFWDFEKIKINK
ncbi:MAG: PrsW family glutamic-type intramembrane protease [Candidatus Paceibacterota bacterium]